MINQIQTWLPHSLLCSLILLSSTAAKAQITPDNTLGAESSLITPNVAINGASANRIDGGAQRGSNLFHSFSQFNVNILQRVYLFNPSDVQNIFARVTGGQGSNILGTLGVDGNANLFLINPNGIVFGRTARLDVRGSFVGTTANSLRFGEQGIFSATNPQAPPLLTINPSALLFNQLSQGTIANQSIASAGVNPVGVNVTGLKVPDGKSLLLVGGNINIDGGALRAYGGNIELTSLAAPGDVGLNVAGDNLGLAIANDIQLGDISLSNGAELNVRGADGGNIKIHARDVNLAGASKLRAGIDTGLGTPNSKGGNIEINATGTITLTGNSFIANVLQERALGKSGDISITTGTLNLTNNASLNASTFGQGDAGSINIKSGSVSITDSTIIANVFGQGNAGGVFIEAFDAVSLVKSDIFSNVDSGGVGNGGDINIKAGAFTLSDTSQLQASILVANGTLAAGRGNAGNVNIDVQGAVTIAGGNEEFSSGIFTVVGTEATGKGGDINIKSGTFSLTDGTVLASTFGNGNAGSIFIQASDSVELKNGSIYSSVEEAAVGKGGNIEIQTGSLR